MRATRSFSARKKTESKVPRVSPETTRKKNCVKLNRLKNQCKEWSAHDDRCTISGKNTKFERVETMQNDNKVALHENTPLSPNKCNMLKPFNAVFSLGDISFTSNDRSLKMCENKHEKENVSKRIDKIRQSSRKRDPKDIYEFTPELEEDWDPTKEVVQKIVKEGRAKLVKRDCGLANKRRTRLKTIPQLLQSLQRYRLSNYIKVLKERKTNSQGSLNQKIWDASSFSKGNVSSGEDSKYERDLEIKSHDNMHPSAEVGCSYDGQEYSEDLGSPKDKKTEITLGNPLKNVEILNVVVLPNRATIVPAVTTREEQEISGNAIDTESAVDQSNEASDMFDMPGTKSPIFDDPGDNFSNQEDYFTIEADELMSSPTSDDLGDNFSNQEESFKREADKHNMSTIEGPSFAQKDSFTIEETSVETRNPKPIRKAFWEEENFEEETLDKSIIKKTYSRPKREESRPHFFIFFSDKGTNKLDESKEEKPSAYYTRSTINDWIKGTKSATGKGTKLDGKRTNKVPAKKAVLKTQNKIYGANATLKLKQKENKVKCKVISKVESKMKIPDSSRVKDRKIRKLHSLRL